MAGLVSAGEESCRLVLARSSAGPVRSRSARALGDQRRAKGPDRTPSMTVRVLVVDQGTALGGSILVACALAREASQFGVEVDLATASDPETIRTRLDPRRPIHH